MAAQIFSSRQSVPGKTKQTKKKTNKHKSVNMSITFAQYCLPHPSKVWILSKPIYSSLSSPYQLLIGRVHWNRMTRLVLLMKSISDMNKQKWALRALKSGSTFDGLCCDSKASSSQFCVIIQVLLCKINRPFLHHSSYSICPWNCCNSVVPAGERFHRTSSWF